ncbi:Protein of unknown function [Bacillus wiedmannii]|uniref:Uncharacterized protein n=2 Tax=Bacillus cereus group TaxID=86661 RepID=A0A1C4GKQ6_BACTU|nr:Protein of unknown function [Bacillus wiedmannii]SCC68790.1 Protein of unknown function [Bacillus thuringiensis]SCN40360.1 Protein of unknown function [Bacillus cereus]SCM12597.1 Protein of unknown function [Bacillus wiedmannii]SCN10584.1 Protein of unknown function [Bacillus wiedmannii]
MDVELLISK